METEAAASGGWSIELWLSSDDRATQAELQRRVWEELRSEALLRSVELRVDVAEDVAVLEGTVDHYLAKAAAERAARRVEGVRGVENRILVRPAAGPSDSELAAAAARALEWNALLPRGRVTVQVAAGVVTLDGTVGRACERAAAADAVSGFAGVTDVRNRIAVRPAFPPAGLQDRVEEVLRHEHARHVRIETLGDRIVLRGRVRSLAQRDCLERAVWAVPGVSAVWDEIEIAR